MPAFDEQAILHLDQAVEKSLAALGELEPNVLGRMVPHMVDDPDDPNGKIMIFWPSNALGKQRIVRRGTGSALFVTQGLSYPFDPSIHGPGIPALGYELAIELPGTEPFGTKTVAATSNEELANSWPVHALWFLANAYVEDRWSLLPRMKHHGGLVTAFLPPLPGIEHSLSMAWSA